MWLKYCATLSLDKTYIGCTGCPVTRYGKSFSAFLPSLEYQYVISGSRTILKWLFSSLVKLSSKVKAKSLISGNSFQENILILEGAINDKKGWKFRCFHLNVIWTKMYKPCTKRFVHSLWINKKIFYMFSILCFFLIKPCVSTQISLIARKYTHD